MSGRMSAVHEASHLLTPAVCVVPQSATAATYNGAGVALSAKRGVYFVVAAGTLTGTATVAAHLEDSPDNTTFTAVNTTTYPEATLAASNTANSVREMHYSCGAGRQIYARAVVVVANNTAIVSCVGATY